jgi:transcription elongation factor Elf1
MSTGKKFRCPDCGGEFELLGELDAHQEVEHLRCPVCKGQFKSREELVEHFATHPPMGWSA